MFKLYPPSRLLQPYIAYYYVIILDKENYDGPIKEICLPSGYCHIAFQLKGRCYTLQNNELQKLSGFYIAGQSTRHYCINSGSEIVEKFGIAFKPTGLYHFFRLDMPSIANKAWSPQCSLKNYFHQFRERLEVEQTDKSRIELTDNILIKKLLDIKPQLNLIDSSIPIIMGSRGCQSIKETAFKLRVGERYLQKNFKRMVGVAPSIYKRIVRFNHIFLEMKANTSTSYKSLAALFNYYDFSHFSKDFKDYCGVCPSEFHLHNCSFLQEFLEKSSSIVNPQYEFRSSSASTHVTGNL